MIRSSPPAASVRPCCVSHHASANAARACWSASVGTDAAPYFRVFNPTLQGKTFDPDGSLNPANAAPGLSGDEFTGNVGALGLYSYVNYRWNREWSAGFLFDWLQSAADKNAETYAYSPFVTYALSHWNQLRLQYTHTEPSASTGLRPDDAIYLQWSWIIGAHSHGWSQR